MECAILNVFIDFFILLDPIFEVQESLLLTEAGIVRAVQELRDAPKEGSRLHGKGEGNTVHKRVEMTSSHLVAIVPLKRLLVVADRLDEQVLAAAMKLLPL